MLVKDLIEQLKDADPNSKVVLSVDPEGNGFCEMQDVDTAALMRVDESSGRREIEVFDSSWTADDCCMDEDEYDHFKKTGPKCVVLWP